MRPWDIQVHESALYGRVLTGGHLALGESYMDGWWDCRALDEFFSRVNSACLQEKVLPLPHLPSLIVSKLLNLQSRSRSRRVGQLHYDLGNELFRSMLDRRMTYTCGYWKDAAVLDDAQEAKLDLVCRKIGLRKGMSVLDVGCGWGSFARFAAEKYGARVTGVTISKDQVRLGNELCSGLPVEIRLQDYRDVREQFDHVVSLGMFEHVGFKNYRTYMETIRRCLRPGGLFLLQTIGAERSNTAPDPWFDRYIFPGGLIPSVKQVGQAAEKLFVMEDWHNFGPDYDRTLMAWHDNFRSHRLKIDSPEGTDERFRRMWSYYLLCLAGAFRARRLQLWQIVLSPTGMKKTYRRSH